MATLQVGRCFTDADCAYLQDAGEQGDGAVRFRGLLAADTLEVTNVARTNLRALRPGTVVPITYAGDPALDAFYQVEDVDVAYGPGGQAGTGSVPFQVAARRIGHDPEAFWQSRFSGVNRNASASCFHAFPASVPIYTPEPAGGLITRALADGSDLYVALGVVRTARPTWEHRPANHYRGAATVKWAATASGTKYTREGLYIPTALAKEFEIGNGLIRAVVNAGSTYGLLLQVWNGSNWTTVTWDFKMVTAGTSETTVGLSNSADRAAVLVNTPELVVVRWEQARGTGTGGRYHLTLSLRRGARFFHFRWGRTTSTTQLGIYRSAADGATAATNYIYDTTGATLAWVLGSVNAYTADTGGASTCGIYLTSAGLTFDGYVGTRNGTGTGENYDDIRNQWYGELVETSYPRRRAGA